MANNENLIPIPGRLHSVATEGHVSGADEIYDDTQQKVQETINSELIAAVGTGGSVDSRIAAAVNVEKTRAEGAESTLTTNLGNEVTRATNAEEALDGRVDTLEEAVGTGGSVDSRISTAVNAAKSEIKGNATSACDTLGEAEALISAEATRAQTAEADRYTKSETYTKEEVHNLVTTPNQEYVSVTATDQTTSVTDVLPETGAADTTYRVGNWDGTQYNDSVFSEYAWNGSAYIKLSTKSQVGEVYDISVNHADTKYADLAAALGTNGANIPQSLRKGGMSVKFVRSSDNKYMQYRCMAQNFTTDVTQWQGVDEEPTVNSNNLVKSSGVFDSNIKLSGNIMSIKQNINNIGYCEIVKAQNGYVRNDGLLIYENTSSVEVMVFDVEGLDEVMLQSFNYSIGVKYYGFYTSIENRAESIDGKHEYVNGYTRISVPSTAKYLAVTTRFSNVGSFDMYKCFSLKTDIKQPSNIIQNKLCIVPLLTVCDGMYLSNTTGNIASAGASDINSIQSAIYSVEGLSEIIISPIDKSNVASASYYSFYANIADANCISGKKNYLVKADTVVSVPATAKYLIILTKFSNQGSYDNLLVTTNDVFRSIEKGLSLVPMYPVDGMLVRNDSFIGQSTIKSFTSDWINVSEGDTFVYQGFGSGSTTLTPSVVSSDSIGCSWLFRNQDHSITAYAIYNSNLTPIDVVIPSDVTAVRFSSISYFEGMYHKFAVVQKNSAIDNIVLHPLKQKRWVVVGDSLTEVNSATTKHYFDYIQENTGIRISNYGVGGSGYKERESEGRSIRQRIETVPVAYDVLTIFGSGNDLHTREGSSEMKYTMGDVTDQTSDTICGCINLTLDWLQANRPLQPVGIITPTPWNTSWGLPTDPDNRMSIYADKLVEIAKRHGVPCLDLYHESMLHPETAAFRNLAYTRDGTYTASQEGTTGAIQVSSWNIDAVQACGLPNAAIGDWILPNLNGIHPDAHGHKLIYPMIQAFMEKILG